MTNNDYPNADLLGAPYDWQAHEAELGDSRWTKCAKCNALHDPDWCWIDGEKITAAELDRLDRLAIECRIVDLLEIVERFEGGDKTVTPFAYNDARTELNDR